MHCVRVSDSARRATDSTLATTAKTPTHSVNITTKGLARNEGGRAAESCEAALLSAKSRFRFLQSRGLVVEALGSTCMITIVIWRHIARWKVLVRRRSVCFYACLLGRRTALRFSGSMKDGRRSIRTD